MDIREGHMCEAAVMVCMTDTCEAAVMVYMTDTCEAVIMVSKRGMCVRLPCVHFIR